MKHSLAYGVYASDGTHRDSAGNFIPRGKVPCALYLCSVPRNVNFTDAMVRDIFPKAHGRTITANEITHGPERSSWMMLLNFRRQSTQADISRGIARLLQWAHEDKRIHVSRIMGVPEQGSSNHDGTSRDGTTQEREASEHVPVTISRIV